MTASAVALRARLVEQAGNRCGYCRAHQHYVYETLHIEHIESRARGGSDDEENAFGWPVRCVTVPSATERMAAIR